MDRNLIVKRLSLARRHAKEGMQQIARQKRTIAVNKLQGKDTRLLSNVLETTQALQAYAEKRVLRLEQQLAALDTARAADKKKQRVLS